jgi:hypothetical protein
MRESPKEETFPENPPAHHESFSTKTGPLLFPSALGPRQLQIAAQGNRMSNAYKTRAQSWAPGTDFSTFIP